MTDLSLSLEKAARMALDALEFYQSKSSVQMFDAAITALREALAEQFCDKHCTWLDHHPDCDKAEQPAQQEPVACKHSRYSVDAHEQTGHCYDCGAEGRMKFVVADIPPAPAQEPFCYHDGRNIVGKEHASHCDVFPLYTAPPAREPLTDEQIEDIWADCPADWDDKINVLTLARAIEAAHGIT